MITIYSLIQNIDNVVLGAAYIRGAAIDTSSMKGSKNVIVITPPVARRAGWKDDETSVFYIKCKNEAELTDVRLPRIYSYHCSQLYISFCSGVEY